MLSSSSTMRKKKNELRRRTIESLLDYDDFKNAQAALKKLKTENTLYCHQRVVASLCHCLVFLDVDENTRSGLKLCLISVCRNFPTPSFALRKGLEYLESQGIDVETKMFESTRNWLQNMIAELLAPEQYYITR